MTTHITPSSPRFLARMTGLFFLLTILTGIFAQAFVTSSTEPGGVRTRASRTAASLAGEVISSLAL